MNPIHIHLLLNHFPIIGTLIAGAVLALGLYKKNTQTQTIATGIMLVLAIIAIPVMLTGESAEETLEHVKGISEPYIELHEQFATIAFWLMECLGLAALITLVVHFRKGNIRLLMVSVLILSGITIFAMSVTGYYGGQIRHTEIKGNIPVNSGSEEEND